MQRDGSLARSAAIDAICDRFEKQWRAGETPRIEDVLAEHAEIDRSCLLRELLLVEFEMRSLRGETPDAADYVTRFPDQTHEIDAALQTIAMRAENQDATDNVDISFDSADETYVPHDPETADTITAHPGTQRTQETGGTRFGDYELLHEIARGGMGVVYKARQTKLNRVVALKMIKSGELAGEQEVKRFQAEAEAAAALDHPGIVPIYEVGEQDGQHFFSMGYIEGRGLNHRLKDGPLPPREAAELIRMIADAVQFAHEKGVVHRDLKPANVLIDAEDKPRVTDFGLAKLIESDSGMTTTGQILGTPSYMPPEQAAGRTSQVGPLADVYSLGALLYSTVTGRPPFQSSNVMETLKQVLETEPVSPRALNPAVDKDLETICLKCLEKDPAKRYGSAKLLAEELSRFLSDLPILARPVGRGARLARWCRRKPVVALLTSVVLVLVLVGLVGSIAVSIRLANDKNELTSTNTRLDVTIGELESANRQKNEEATKARLQARTNHNHLVTSYVANGLQRQDEGDLFGATVWFAEALRLDEERARVEEENRDAQIELHRIRIAATLRDCARPVCAMFHEGPVSRARFSPNGKWIVTVSGAKARVWNATTGERVADGPTHLGNITGVEFTPDSRNLVTSSEDKTIQYWSAASGKPLLPPFQHVHPVVDISMGPEGKRLAAACSTGLGFSNMKHPSEIRLWKLDSGESVVAVQSSVKPFSRVIFSPNGKHVVTANRSPIGSEVQVWEATGLRKPPEIPGVKSRFLLSPVRGKSVTKALFHQSPQVGYRHSGTFNTVAYSPDGRYLLTTMARGSREIMLAASPGGRSAELFLGEARLWDARTGEPVGSPMKTRESISTARFSPDGRFVVTGSADQRIRLWDAQTGKLISTPRKQPDGISQVRFSPDGRYYASVLQDGSVRVFETDSAQPVTPIIHVGSFVRHVSFSPDGSRLLLASKDGTARVWSLITQSRIAKVLRHPGNVIHDIAFRDGGRTVSTAGGFAAQTWNVADRSHMSSIFDKKMQTRFSTFSRDGRWLFAIDERTRDKPGTDGRVRILARTGYLFATDTADSPPREVAAKSPVCAAFHPDGTQIAIGQSNKEARIWNVKSGEPVAAPMVHQHQFVNFIVYSKDGRHIVTGCGARSARGRRSGEEAIYVWDARSGLPIGAPIAQTMHINHLAVSPDGNRIAVALGDGRRRGGRAVIYDALNGSRVIAIEHLEDVAHVEFSPDGKWLVTASDDRTARVWDATTGRPRARPMVHEQMVNWASFSSDGRFVVTGCGTSTDRPAYGCVWNARTGEAVTPPLRHDGQVTIGRFGPNTTHVMTGGHDWTARLWDLKPDSRPLAELQALAHSMSGRRLDITGGLVGLDQKGYRDSWTLFAERNPASDNAAQRLAWHRQESNRCRKKKQWFALVKHLDELVKVESSDPSHFNSRGVAHANLGHPQLAHADLSRAIALGRETTQVRLNRGKIELELEDWEGAVADFTHVLKQRPSDGPAHYLRGQALAELKKWNEAAADLSRAVAISKSDRRGLARYIRAATNLAMVQIHLNQRDAYQSLCAELVKRFGRTRQPALANAVAWICCLAPDAVADYKPVVALGERAFAGSPKRHAYINTSGVVLFRAGQFERAEQRLQASIAADPESSKGGSVQDWAVLAMVSHKLGKKAEALKHLQNARTAAARRLKTQRDPGSSGRGRPDWDLRLVSELLIREAAEMIGK